MFDHEVDTGVALGLALFEQREGVALWNQDLTNAVWVKNNITPAKDAVGLDGSANSASTITATAANGTVLQTVTSGSAERAATAYVKRKTGTGSVEFTQDGGTTWADITASLSTSLWYRPAVIQTVTNPQIGFRLGTNGDEIEVDIVGLEAGAVATSPIPTTTASVTRELDECITTDVDWFNQSAGTLFVQASIPFLSATTRHLVQVDDGSSNDRIYINLSSINKIVTRTINSAGDDGGSLAAGAITAATAFKAVIAYANDDVIHAFDGTLGTQDVTADIPLTDTLTALRVGTVSGNVQMANGHIQAIKYWNVRKLDAFLQSVST